MLWGLTVKAKSNQKFLGRCQLWSWTNLDPNKTFRIIKQLSSAPLSKLSYIPWTPLLLPWAWFKAASNYFNFWPQVPHEISPKLVHKKEISQVEFQLTPKFESEITFVFTIQLQNLPFYEVKLNLSSFKCTWSGGV